MKNELPFGGKTLLMAGDFRQTLAIYKHCSVTDIISIPVKKSNIWPNVKKCCLTENLRANTSASQFKNWTIDLGDGKLASKFQTDTEDVIALPNECVLENNSMVDVDHNTFESNLITYVYGNTGDNILFKIQKENVAILCPKNEDVLSVNEKILDLIDGEKTVYTSADEIQKDEYNENEIYPQEFINTVTPNGMPPHLLNLKINCVVILLTNLNHQIGLCNGTRLIVKKLLNHIIVAERKYGCSNC